jgi:hypothetical protein
MRGSATFTMLTSISTMTEPRQIAVSGNHLRVVACVITSLATGSAGAICRWRLDDPGPPIGIAHGHLGPSRTSRPAGTTGRSRGGGVRGHSRRRCVRADSALPRGPRWDRGRHRRCCSGRQRFPARAESGVPSCCPSHCAHRRGGRLRRLRRGLATGDAVPSSSEATRCACQTRWPARAAALVMASRGSRYRPHAPVLPSTPSRSRSRCPQCWAYSVIIRSTSQRRSTSSCQSSGRAVSSRS